MQLTLAAVAVLALAATVVAPAAAQPPPAVARSQPATSAQALVDDLLATDRAFAAAAAERDIVAGLSAMFVDDVVMPVAVPAPGFARNRAEAVAALRANPSNLVATTGWVPVRGGVSADGQHGFTIGYMTIREAGKPDRKARYLGYWLRRPEGWRIAVYKRVGQPEGDFSTAPLPPSLPASMVAPEPDAATVERHRQSLISAEQSFSDEAQRIGLAPAFRKFGRPDSTNVGGVAAFTVGAEAIAANLASQPARPIRWAADEGALVASSGDLGITWGYIRSTDDSGAATAFPFFTIWRRDSVDAPWRYIAE